jgi:valyl-tRNA synthetase
MTPNEPLAPQYDAAAVEARLYADWMARDLFRPSAARGGAPYVIMIPLPNVTAALHMGHGLNDTVQDVLIRFERMRGREALWQPGTDHAGIATQNVVERLLAQEGKTRFDQLKAIGCSCDWSRTKFTLDPDLSRAVREAFVRLWEDGLIYRGHRVIHWCPRCHTSLSDEEAEHEEIEGALYHLRYPLAEGGGHVTVATTRPETMLGDVAVAVNPKDAARLPLVGRQARLPIAGVLIPVIADEHVETGFGTGFVKITPAHDADDFEVGRRHGLPMPVVMTPEGLMADAALEGKAGGRVPAPYFGMDRFDARKAIVAALKADGLLERIEQRLHAVRHCYRCGTVVEPRLSDQWFVRMAPLAEPALRVYREGKVRFIPERRGDEYEQWMTGIRDWNISRQLWWGHRIPVWYCDACGTQKAYREDPAACPDCGGPLRQDEDVLDTWFSSWLWPFSTLGWPDETPDLARYYPGDVLVTAPEILFFWVARMIMAGLRFRGDIPFHTVYLHGTVRDTKHRKMSKSLGNGIDPLEVVRRYGADALRFTVTSGLAVGTDIILDPDDLESSFAPGRNFANKTWNIGRLLLSHVGGMEVPPLAAVPAAELRLADRWILSRLQRVVADTTAHLEAFRLNDAVGEPYHFLWDEFADWYLEEIKARLRGEEPGGDAARAVAVHVFDAVLRLLHPAMPFITEELFRRLPGREDLTLVTAEWPSADPARQDEAAGRDFGRVQALVDAIRAVRAEYAIKPGQVVHTSLASLPAAWLGSIAPERGFVARIARTALDDAPVHGPAAQAVLPDGHAAAVALGDVIDVAKECARVRGELERLDGQLAALAAKLANEGFTGRAPADVVQRERDKERQWTEKRGALAAKLAALSCA